MDDADRGVKIALEAVTKDGYGDKNDNTLGIGFNAHAKGDVEDDRGVPLTRGRKDPRRVDFLKSAAGTPLDGSRSLS
ncbi:hypothetical protein ACFWM7_22670 [Streptomyces sp. NPDC058375]|uniref:hypothetical protein n=1 Tax=Streptomyces sp. NPDC058375 TaxID=3346467 RepID=UPI003662F78B